MNIDEIIKQRLEKLGYSIQDEPLGEGGFGVTYLAIDRKNQERWVVIKAIRSQLIRYMNLERRLEKINTDVRSFDNETNMLRRLEHRNIVQIYEHIVESFEVKDLFKQPNLKGISTLELSFPIMEYIEGKNLREFVEEQSDFLQEAEVLHYIQQIGAALIVVHSKNILHRDIKPENIMVRKDTNDAVLIDFGIARDFVPEITQSKTVSYTDPYAPPEQLRRRDRPGNYTDIYSLAATLYYLLTKELPASALIRMSYPNDFVQPKTINPNISDSVNDAILWGMELEYSKRPQKVEDWLTELLRSSDELSSDRNVDYTRLRDLLSAGNWKDADYETYLVMLKVVGREKDDWIMVEELLNFPCTDLHTIDRLWVKYSKGRFGFSVQKKIYLQVGGKADGVYHEEAWNKFGDRVGWKNKEWIKYSEVIFDTSSPEGHLPIPPEHYWDMRSPFARSYYVFRSPYRPNNWMGVSSLASRLVNCNL